MAPSRQQRMRFIGPYPWVGGCWIGALSATRPVPPHPRQSLRRHERRSALVLDQDHQELRRLGGAGVAVDEMNVVGAFIEGLSRRQGYLFSALQLHDDGALQHIDERMGVVPVDCAR